MSTDGKKIARLPGAVATATKSRATTTRGDDSGTSQAGGPAAVPPSAILSDVPSKDAGYELTERDRDAARKLLDIRSKRAPDVRLKVESGKDSDFVRQDHPDRVVGLLHSMAALGLTDVTLYDSIVSDLGQLAGTGNRKISEHRLNYALSIVKAMEPRDATEALLAVQMAAIHKATLVAAWRLSQADTLDHQDSASNMLNKLARTFAVQVEALKKYRSTGEQSIRVQYVNVNAAQAVVGINEGGGGAIENASQSHALAAPAASSALDARCAALFGHEQAQPLPLPGAGREGEAGMSDARGTRRGPSR